MTSPYEERPWLSQYPKEVPADIEVPDASVNDLFDKVTEKYPKRSAIIFYGNKLSYAELREKVDRFATALADLGVKKGDRVALLLLNCPEHVIAFYAVLKLGAAVTAVSPVYVSSEIRHQLEDSQVDTIICQDFLYQSVEKTGLTFKNIILADITASLPKFKKLLGKSILRGVYQKMAPPNRSQFDTEGFLDFHELLSQYPPNPPQVKIDAERDMVTLPYTGGTTGKPKGVMITHRNVVANLTQFRAFLYMLDEGKEVWIAYMPFYHAAGQAVALLFGVLQAYTLVIITTPDVDDILNSIVRYQPNAFFAAPTLYEMLKDHKKTDQVHWAAMKLIMSGADALREKTARDWKERSGADIYEGFGQTECVVLTHETPYGNVKVGSVGVPVSSTYAAIVDPFEDELTPVGEIGELVISGPQVTPGYWQNENATRDCEALINDRRWWRTGDLGRMEEDGFFYIYDRKRDLIKYKGLRVYAREVEEVIMDHPSVREVGVIGVPDPKVGEQVKAMIVLETESRGSVSEADITDYCKELLAAYKIPRIIEFVGEVPKTDVGKVSRRELREEEA